MKSLWERSYTAVSFPPSGLNLSPSRFVLSAGSCFAEELHRYLKEHYISCSFSPQGISYNPLSLSKGLDLLSGAVSINREELFLQDGLWKHSLFHGSRNRPDPEEYLNSVNKELEHCRSRLQETPLLVITLGTSWVYRRRSTGEVVNNCHREKADLFERSLLSIEEMKRTLRQSLSLFRETFPGTEAVISVSPVRHLRNDPRENSLSKARLLCLSQELAAEIPWLNYFPSWEIVMDELRDYRWYDRSLNHLSGEAIVYIMERFSQWAGSPDFLHWLKEGEKLRKRLEHRGESSRGSFSEFQEKTRKEMERLKQLFPHFRALAEEEGRNL